MKSTIKLKTNYIFIKDEMDADVNSFLKYYRDNSKSKYLDDSSKVNQIQNQS